MHRLKIAAGSFAAGAALMYFCDPARGRRRRAGVRDKTLKTYSDFTWQLEKAGRDLSNRTRGVVAEAWSLTAKPDPAALAERVKTRIGRVVSHPHAISVTAEDGAVTLSGPVLESEVETLLRTVRAVPGVHEVHNRLDVHAEAGNISSLQGGRRREVRSEFAQSNWTPALRFAAGGLGGVLWLLGARKGGIFKLAGKLVGTSLITRAVANRDFREIAGMDGGASTVKFDKTVHIDATVEEVFAFWSNYSNFPRFMSHLREVRDRGDGKSQWVAEGPGGFPVSWDAEVTQNVPNQLMAWRSLPGSQVQTEGWVRFDPNENGGTRVTVRLCYSPPAGMIGHLVASIFGSDPKREMDDDMIRLKALIEIGKTRAHHRQVSREEILGAPAVSHAS